MRALYLTYVSFDRVEFVLVDDDGERPVVVRVGRGHDWRRAMQFPTCATTGTETTGDPALDAAIRERAAEALVQLEAALVVREGWGVA
jgi:hypothetical protein